MALRINIPPLTRGLLIGLIALSALNASIRYHGWAIDPERSSSYDFRVGTKYSVTYLTLVPPKSIAYPWTTLTSAVIEQNVVSFAASGLTIFYGGRYLERAWGSQEFGIFCLFVTMIPNLLTLFIYSIWFAVTSSQPALYVSANDQSPSY